MAQYRRVMAIDQATLSGVAWTEDLCGETRFSTTFSVAKSADSRAGKHRVFAGHLTKLIQAKTPDLVVYEKPSLGMRMAHSTALFLLGLSTVIEMVCEAEKVAYQPVAGDTIKTHGIGKEKDRKAWIRAAELFLARQGATDSVIKDRRLKTAMMLAAEDAGWVVRTDDEADALWLLDLACLWIREGKLR